MFLYYNLSLDLFILSIINPGVIMKFSVWSDKEVKDLFEVVEGCKKENRPLKEAFIQHARKYCRKENSVRNYYYHEVDNLEKDSIRQARLGIDLSKHTKTKLIPFSKKQEEEFLENVKTLQKQGYSVRSACIKLSGGDMTLMTRLQNKFQNLKKENVGDNIITFKKKEKNLSMNDINSLFLGLAKLIKKSTYDEAEEKFKSAQNASEILLKDAYNELNAKTKELKHLKNEYEILKNENLRLTEKLNIIFQNKNEKLKNKFDTMNEKINKLKA